MSVLCRGFFEKLMSLNTLKWGGGLENADVIRGGGGGRSMLTVADRGEGGIKFAKILLTSYVNAPFITQHFCLCSKTL